MSPLTVQQRSGNNVHAQCADVFRAILTTSGEAVLPVRYELNLKYHHHHHHHHVQGGLGVFPVP